MLKKKTKKTRQQTERSIKIKCDALFSKLVRLRDRRCLRCGKVEHLQCNHIITREDKQFRWDFTNAITLCAGCHLYWWHKPTYPDQNSDWLQSNYPEYYKYFLKNKGIHKKASLIKFKVDWSSLEAKILDDYSSLEIDHIDL